MAFLFGSPPIFWVGRLLVSGSVFLIEMSCCLWPDLNLVNVICIAVSPTAYQPISHNFLMTCLDQLGISPGTDHPKEILMGVVWVVSKFRHFFSRFPYTLSITKTARPRKDVVPLLRWFMYRSHARSSRERRCLCESDLGHWEEVDCPPHNAPRQQKSSQKKQGCIQGGPSFFFERECKLTKKNKMDWNEVDIWLIFLEDLVVVILWHYVFFRCLLGIRLLRGGLVYDLISWRIGWTKRVLLEGTRVPPTTKYM